MRRLTKSLLRALGAQARQHKDATIIRALSALCHQVHIGYHNIQFDGDRNGELKALRRICRDVDIRTVFDIGAHVGKWALQMRQICPDAQIHCFEPLGGNFRKLKQNISNVQGVYTNNFGIARHDGLIPMAYSSQGDQTTATTSPVVSHADQCGGFDRKDVCCFRNPDAYMRAVGVTHIDFLKVDAEGMDFEVLISFDDLSGSVRIIQFEYTMFSRLNRILLRDFFDLLQPQEYRIYKILPHKLELLRYDRTLEDVPAGNYLAVHGRAFPPTGPRRWSVPRP